MKRNLLLLIALVVCAYSFAQGEIDALNYSRTDLTGTARGQAMGGAFGALGADVTGVNINPAGVAVYRSSEVVANMNFASTNTKTKWGNLEHKDDKFKFYFDNIAYMGYFPVGNDVVKAINFGFNYNRLKDFHRNYSASGKGMKTSLTHYIPIITDGVRYSYLDEDRGNEYRKSGVPWLGILGWQGFLMDRITEDSYESILGDDETVNPQMKVTEKGHIETYDFSIGSNFSDKFYLGVTFSLTDLYYRMSSYYTEGYEYGGYFDLDNYLETDGSGYQVKVGAIWLPTDFLRVGVSYHSPTWYSLTDYYYADVYTEYENTEGNLFKADAATPSGRTDYDFQSPYSWTFSLAGVIGTKAIVSLDYEIKDYTTMNLKDENGYNLDIDNDYIDDDFKVASTIRAGLEYRITPQLSARAGYAWMQNPYEKKFKDGDKEAAISGTIPHYTVEGDVSYITCGIGYKFTPNFYVDAAFVYRTQEDDLYFFPKVYDLKNNNRLMLDSTPASMKNKTYKGMLTLGYKF